MKTCKCLNTENGIMTPVVFKTRHDVSRILSLEYYAPKGGNDLSKLSKNIIIKYRCKKCNGIKWIKNGDVASS